MNIDELKKKFGEIKETPAAVLGLLYPYILIIILAIGIFYLSNVNNIERQTVPPNVLEVKAANDIALQEPKTVPPIDIMKMSKPTDELIAKGKTIFTNVCSTCHGTEGNGKGPGAAGLNPPPRNFTQNNSWVNGRTISDMYTTLMEGIPNSGMVAYENLTPEDKLGVIHYIRSTFMKDPPVDSKSDLEALDQQYNLSAGVKLPGQIPIEYAEDFIIKENEAKIKKVDKALSLIKKESNTSSAKLFQEVTNNTQIALSYLVNSDSWRKSESALINFLTVNMNQDGFNGTVFNLSDSEWNALYNYLIKII
jgi:mono/diheme cytochrome c family protein